MDFGEVLSKAWKIVWKFKILWIFGIFAGCGARGSGNFGGSGSSFQSGGGIPGQVPNFSPGFEDNLFKIVQFFEMPAVIIGFISLICVLILITIFLSIMGRVGLIKGAVQADAGAERLSFGELWRSGLHYFWRMFGLSLLIGSPILLIYLALAAAGILVLFAFLSGSRSGSYSAIPPVMIAVLPLTCIFLCVIFILALVISFLLPQAERAIVIEEEGVISGLRRGWNVLTKNLGPILIIWFILMVIGVAAGILLALPVLIIVFPAVIALVLGGNNPSYAPLIIAGLCLAAYIPVSIVANGILTSYFETVWSLTFLRLTKAPSIPQADLASSNA